MQSGGKTVHWAVLSGEGHGSGMNGARLARRQLLGALAQLGERLICIQEVRSSILLGSTKVELGDWFVENGSVAQVVRAHA